jgi:hypothetical protein
VHIRRPRSSSIPRLTFALAVTGAVLVACGETITQIGIDDVVELRLSVDSAQVGVDRTLQIRALALDETGALLSGQSAEWLSTAPTVASVDDDGLVMGIAIGTARIIATVGSLTDTTFVTVLTPQTLVLSADSVGFVTVAGSADPAPDTVDVTNAGQIALAGIAVDSILYGPGATGWLSADVDSPVAPTTIEL